MNLLQPYRRRFLRGSIFSVHVAAILAVATVQGAMAQGGQTQGRNFDCLLQPRLTIKVATHVSGVLKDVPVDLGDTVRKGDIIARLESGVEKAMLDLAEAKAESDASVKAREARLVYLRKKRERTAELRGKGNASAAALDEAESDLGVASEDLREAESNYRIARLEVARASEVLKLRTIYSPIDGVISERKLLGGEYAFEQAHIATIAQIDPLNVRVFVPVALYGSIRAGMEAVVSWEKPVGGRHKATVEVVDPLIDSATDTFNIRLVLPNPNNKLPAGLRCKVEFPSLTEIR